MVVIMILGHYMGTTGVILGIFVARQGNSTVLGREITLDNTVGTCIH